MTSSSLGSGVPESDTAGTEPVVPDLAIENPNHQRRWLVLGIVALAQLMVVLDSTIVSIALPDAQADLSIGDGDRSWVVTSYALAFGALLLLGGRIADYWGRKRSFIVGMVGFAAMSGIGGIAQNGIELFAARAGQGVFAALVAPAALAILTTTFTREGERAKAFAVYGAISGGGAAIGLLLGGALTQYVDWRWCLLVNIPIAVIAIAAAVPVVKETKAHGDTSYDLPGAVLVAVGLGSLVYGFTSAEHGWLEPDAIGCIVAGLIVLALFAVVEHRSTNPLLPLSVPWDRNRGSALIGITLAGVALVGSTLYLAIYLQAVLGFSPLVAGTACLPITAFIAMSSGIAAKLAVSVGPKVPMSIGPVIAAGGLLLLAQVDVGSSYWTGVFPALAIFGFGMGLLIVPVQNVALIGVRDHDAGAASALSSASMQVGAALGTALLTTVYTSAKTDALPSVPDAPDVAAFLDAEVAGYTSAFAWAAGLLVLASPVMLILARVRKDELPAEGAVHMG
jgi:EmrB/QacA subfamily drug resistance transporter